MQIHDEQFFPKTVNLDDLSNVIFEQRDEEGDSFILIVRRGYPRRHRRTRKQHCEYRDILKPRPILFLCKYGHDAIAEMVSSLLSIRYGLPTQSVCWAIDNECETGLVIAINYEKRAFFPERITGSSIEDDNHEIVLINNLQDYYNHLALAKFLGDEDGVQVMVRRNGDGSGTLFRIDAAASLPFGYPCDWKDFDRFLDIVVKRKGTLLENIPSVILDMWQTIADDNNMVAWVMSRWQYAPIKIRSRADAVQSVLNDRQTALRYFLRKRKTMHF